MHAKVPISAKIFKSKVLREDINRRMLLPIFENHHKRIEELIGKENVAGSYRKKPAAKIGKPIVTNSTKNSTLINWKKGMEIG